MRWNVSELETGQGADSRFGVNEARRRGACAEDTRRKGPYIL